MFGSVSSCSYPMLVLFFNTKSHLLWHSNNRVTQILDNKNYLYFFKRRSGVHNCNSCTMITD